MQMTQIQLQSRLPQLEISITPPQQLIEQPKAELDLQQPKAQMYIQTTPGQLTIDQTRAWESMDIKHIFRRIEENAQKGHNDVLNGIARTAAEGDELMQIEYGGSPIASQATRNSKLIDYDYNIGFVPPPFSVKMDYQPARVDSQVELGQVSNNTVAMKPIIDYKQGQVNYSMKQHAELSMDFIDLKL